MDTELKATKHRPGWLIPYLTALDHMYYKRWDYWLQAVKDDKIPREPIPYIHFRAPYCYDKRQVQKNLKKCLDYANHYSSRPLDEFIDWILWGFNHRRDLTFPAIDERIDDYWYRTFNLGLFYEEPADHFADIACESYVGKYHGYFPTPPQVVEMMVHMNFGDEPLHDHKQLSVCDPCFGTGVMLLYASNYSLNLWGVDINHLLTKIAIVNAYIYVPWLVHRPRHLTMFDNVDSRESIVEIELPTGIKIPRCTRCNNGSEYLLELETAHEIEVNPLGFFNIHQPKISGDVVSQRLKPDNITCAKCFREEVPLR